MGSEFKKPHKISIEIYQHLNGKKKYNLSNYSILRECFKFKKCMNLNFDWWTQVYG